MDTNCIFALVTGIIVVLFGCVFVGMGFRLWDEAHGLLYVVMGVGVIAMGAVLITSSFSANRSIKERDALESKAVESYKDGAELYINGEKKDNIDLNGVNLDNYDITVEKDKIYLKEK